MMTSSLRHVLCLATMSALMLHTSQASSQQEPGKLAFDSVQVEEIRPEELGGGVPLEDPASLLTPDIEDLSSAFTDKEREALLAHVSANVVEVVALHMPPEPYEQVPMIYRGHAVWLSSHEGARDPVLISTLSWLKDAKEIYIVPTQEKKSGAAAKKKSSPRFSAGERSLDQLSSGKDAWRAFKKQKKDYVRAELGLTDRMRGLAMLTTDAKGTPARGLSIIPESTKSLTFLFGYTYIDPDRLTNARLLPARSELDELSFFFLNTYVATLGAPLFNEKGHVVMLNALPNPNDPKLSLGVPPGSLRSFVATAQAEKK